MCEAFLVVVFKSVPFHLFRPIYADGQMKIHSFPTSVNVPLSYISCGVNVSPVRCTNEE